MQPYFDQLEQVRFEGTGSKNPLAFRHYNPDEIVLGKRMDEHLRFAACYWHTFCWTGADMFGVGAFERPWQQAGISWRWQSVRPMSPSNSSRN